MAQIEGNISCSVKQANPIPILNYDILIYSMLFLTDSIQYDLLPMMQTCRVLYQAGIPLLVRRVELDLDRCLDSNNPSQLQVLDSFSLFICTDPTRRSLHVRELYISIKRRQNIDSQSIRAFAQVLKQFHNLIALRIFDAEYWLGLDSSLEDAVSTLPNLRAIDVSSPKHDSEINMTVTARVLNRLTAPVRLLNLHCPSPSAQDLFGILRNLAPTLEYLTIWKLTLT
ncbi:hypothetical protein QCA50_014400 [Cerrena zonata]|uniref:Uncharacterized protein n=1 Tax=Cerrena zonata TaxID=2478898 RepID=A0AAW0G0Q6_9APHY